MIPLDRAREFLEARLRGEEPAGAGAEAQAGGEGGARPRWRRIIAALLIAVGALGITVAAAAIISNILAGTTTITGLTISPQTSPLIPTELSIKTPYQNSIIVSNPADAALKGVFVFNFTLPIESPSADDVEVWVDHNPKDNTIQNTDKLTCLVREGVVSCRSREVSIPSGSSSWLMQVKFNEDALIGKSVEWKAYVESA